MSLSKYERQRLHEQKSQLYIEKEALIERKKQINAKISAKYDLLNNHSSSYPRHGYEAQGLKTEIAGLKATRDTIDQNIRGVEGAIKTIKSELNR